MNFEPTRERVNLLLYAADVATLLTQYTHIEVSRALTADGILEAVTAWTASKAAITVGNEGPYLLNGTVLELELPDGSTLSYVFTGPNPITAAAAAAELNLASPLLDCTTSGNKLVLRTLGTGSGAVLVVKGGDACHFLDVAYLTTAFGQDANVDLVTGQVLYSYADLNGDLGYTYRYRFVKQTPPAQSIYLGPTAIGQDVTVALNLLAVGKVKATSLQGLSQPNVEVHVTNRYVPPDIGGQLIINDQVKKLDASGIAAFPLIKGSKVEFYVSGTPNHRTITVPNVAEFDMLDPTLVADDPWGIVVPPYTALPRTTL
ncbi:MAG: hypothetical protein GYA36_19610 [Veillonellaceae bacterium]|nr:hypothetical protein [Veillonellaceae bacterium]